MYTIIFDEQAINYLETLPQGISTRIFKKIRATKEDPHHFFVRLTNRQEYKLRVGDYRVIADIDDNKIIIYIITINHRNKVYKRSPF